MWSLITLFLGRIFSNPIVRSVASNTLSGLVTYGSQLIPLAIAEMKEAATRDDLSGIGKLNLVVSKLSEQFPGIARDVIVSVVTNTFAAAQNPDVKEIAPIK